MTVRRFVYPYINANMYFIVDNGRAIVIDPHQSDELRALLTSQDINDILILLTHEHPDHTSGGFVE
ncbi:MBL fold metallo-hydrolase [Candidatus Symbiopectobacterium sp.]|uniref:MBL fold metallo-hydrolase n=1 Tax=Candidatus Symbiopectobacterium sp. TaxID=2816440 RepID=UPI0025B9F040|nr:MBL fold metallo-hydrolase [Candidatus Symbiopectobacterium sp.]